MHPLLWMFEPPKARLQRAPQAHRLAHLVAARDPQPAWLAEQRDERPLGVVRGQARDIGR